MLKLSKLVGLEADYKRLPLFPFMRKISRLHGNIRGKEVELFTTRQSRMPANIAIRMPLEAINDVSFCAFRRQLGVAILKALGRPIIASGDPILDRKIVFQTRNIDFARNVFAYEETRDKFDELFSGKFSGGKLAVGQSSIFYHEPMGILTQKRRERFVVAIDLLCDLFDILYFYKRKIHD